LGTPGRIAHVHLVESFHYRPDAFCNGLNRYGYSVVAQPLDNPSPGDVLICWNRYQRDEAIIQRYERAGAYVLITENAWLGPESKEHHWFALAHNHHNGAGRWHVGSEPRRVLETLPWRTNGDYVLVLPQRGMGEPSVRQDRDWLRRTLLALQFATRRPVRVREHPGFRPHPEIDWKDVWATVTWASGAAIKGIVAGVPCFYEFPKWIGAPGARFGFEDIEAPYRGDRTLLLTRLSWCMWDAHEIARGEPFEWLLRPEYSYRASSGADKRSDQASLTGSGL
jgi:hypothetical protein